MRLIRMSKSKRKIDHASTVLHTRWSPKSKLSCERDGALGRIFGTVANTSACFLQYLNGLYKNSNGLSFLLFNKKRETTHLSPLDGNASLHVFESFTKRPRNSKNTGRKRRSRLIRVCVNCLVIHSHLVKMPLHYGRF
jgi:hypothetical protein